MCPLPPFEQRCSSRYNAGDGDLLSFFYLQFLLTSAAPRLPRRQLERASAAVWTGFTETCGTERVRGQIKPACSKVQGDKKKKKCLKVLRKPGKKQLKWFTPLCRVAGLVPLTLPGSQTTCLVFNLLSLISSLLMVWFHLISKTSLTGAWSQSNAAILDFKTLKLCDKRYACE